MGEKCLCFFVFFKFRYTGTSKGVVIYLNKIVLGIKEITRCRKAEKHGNVYKWICTSKNRSNFFLLIFTNQRKSDYRDINDICRILKFIE